MLWACPADRGLTHENARALWTQRTAVGGDGGALKDPQSEYRPGQATEAWLKVKARAAVTWAQRM